MKLNKHLQLLPRLRIVDIYLLFPMHLKTVVLNMGDFYQNLPGNFDAQA
jgi:hypothetical protein